MRDLRSQLDDVPGIGPRRRRALLTKFGSLAGVRRATREELDAVVGPKAAAAVIDLLRKVRVNFRVRAGPNARR
jgi:excinuclease ABC subunit C